MAKGKNVNPADAFRKAERKKELKKVCIRNASSLSPLFDLYGLPSQNKTERQKAREFALVKKDTTSIEEDIERLEKAEKDNVISPVQKTQLESLKTELDRINKKKEEYVTEHPEHRRLVYRGKYKKAPQDEENETQIKGKQRNVFDKNGLPRHPERSIYYDPVMNPYGVPPPGLPYMERQGLSDDDIVMPAGPPPSHPGNENEENEDSDDDIPMPEGPPPNKMPLLLSGHPPLPPGPPPNFGTTPFPSIPFIAAPLQPPHLLSHPPASAYPITLSSLSPRIQSLGSMQDPLAPYPHQPYQAYQSERRSNHPLPNKPMIEVTGPGPSSATTAAENINATISAPAELRDLKKESTSFVPASLKRKRLQGDARGSKRINAAPEEGETSKEGNAQARPDLLDTLRSNLSSSIMKRPA
ncbi:hypothetical protein Clacol_007493 [Clathrus columnatus]|uniref:Wbp11/ELF5/Saf1 N-terminal domain-containing protein n=1 Tax=Clathrus columnatus TaxID=1419009 RepID=A0AAV5AHV4_9AGAM|nr:hypothetical protein Clacol_007493 [Clathrus columnatus]